MPAHRQPAPRRHRRVPHRRWQRRPVDRPGPRPSPRPRQRSAAARRAGGSDPRRRSLDPGRCRGSRVRARRASTSPHPYRSPVSMPSVFFAISRRRDRAVHSASAAAGRRRPQSRSVVFACGFDNRDVRPCQSTMATSAWGSPWFDIGPAPARKSVLEGQGQTVDSRQPAFGSKGRPGHFTLGQRRTPAAARRDASTRIAATETPNTPAAAINTNMPLARPGSSCDTAPNSHSMVSLEDGSSRVFGPAPDAGALVPGRTDVGGVALGLVVVLDVVVEVARGGGCAGFGVEAITVTVMIRCAPRSSAHTGSIWTTITAGPPPKVTGTVVLSGSDFVPVPTRSVAVRPVRLTKFTTVPDVTVTLDMDGVDGHASAPRLTKGLPTNVTVVIPLATAGVPTNAGRTAKAARAARTNRARQWRRVGIQS